MSTQKMAGLLAVAAVLAIIAWLLLQISPPQGQAAITSFDQCAAAGYPIEESFPEQCRTPDGRVFVKELPRNTTTEGTTTTTGTTFNGCAVAGCSHQLCVEAGEADTIVTTCEYRAEYACYKNAHCERQPNGRCGWTPTAALQACLKNPPKLDTSEPLPQ